MANRYVQVPSRQAACRLVAQALIGHITASGIEELTGIREQELNEHEIARIGYAVEDAVRRLRRMEGTSP